MNPAELKGSLEAIIYAADEPATLDQLAKATETDKDAVRAALEEMIAAFAAGERGVELRRVARGYRFSTKPEHHEVVRKFIKSLRPPVRLSMPALETLAVIAYKQPITLPEIQDIRGVNCSGVIQTLLEKRLVTTAGRKTVIGRPILYRTTKEFLVRFGLNDVDELPSLKEFEQLAREALGPDAGIEIVPEDENGEVPAAEDAETMETAPNAEGEQPAEPETAEPAATGAGEEAALAEEETAGTELSAAEPAVPAESKTNESDSTETESTANKSAEDANPGAIAPGEPHSESAQQDLAAEPQPAVTNPEPAQTEPEPPTREPASEPAAEEETPGKQNPSP